MHGALLAAVHPDNTPHGYNLTFAFPMLMFIIIAGALYLRFRGSHNVPGHVPFVLPEAAAATEAAAVVEESAGGASVEPAADKQVRPAGEGTEES